MPKICYKEKRFGRANKALVALSNDIIEGYQDMNMSLTLRQLYYRLVAAGHIPNTVPSYNKLGRVITDARLAGMVDWLCIEDRERNVAEVSTWDSPKDILKGAANSYNSDKWEHQDSYIEVWVEKKALESVIAQACSEYEVPYLACKGYMSASEMWRAAQRFIGYEDNGQTVTIIHLGDHDPSGIDMTRDIQHRLWMFECDAKVRRIALNMDQIREFNPPPNPAKITDSRCNTYVDMFGVYDSWELDAIEPRAMIKMIEDIISEYVDNEVWNNVVSKQEVEREYLQNLADKSK